MANYDNAFKPNKPLIHQMDYSNKNELLHNNVNDDVLDENIIEYKIDIDSIDRDISKYPDPFTFVVKFAPIPNRNNQSNPSILIDFRNVKYVKLAHIILPTHTKIIKNKNDNHDHDHNDDDDEYIFDSHSNIFEDRFVQLVIKELTNTNTQVYTTADDTTRYTDNDMPYSPPRPFGLITCDKLINRNYFSGTTCNAIKIYEKKQLGNITQLSISFMDSYGIPIKMEGIEKNEKNDKLSRNDLRHPLNKKTQVHLVLLIGVVTSAINNTVQYAR